MCWVGIHGKASRFIEGTLLSVGRRDLLLCFTWEGRKIIKERNTNQGSKKQHGKEIKDIWEEDEFEQMVWYTFWEVTKLLLETRTGN